MGPWTEMKVLLEGDGMADLQADSSCSPQGGWVNGRLSSYNGTVKQDADTEQDHSCPSFQTPSPPSLGSDHL